MVVSYITGGSLSHAPPGFVYFWLGGLIVASIVGAIIWIFVRK
jgi:hypothetical protein